MNNDTPKDKSEHTPSIRFSHWQHEIDQWFSDKGWEYWSDEEIVSQLAEGVGELAKEVKHRFGDKKKRSDEQDGDLAGELGDIMYAVVCFANKHGIRLADLPFVEAALSLDTTVDPRRLANRLFADAGRFAGVVDSFYESNEALAKHKTVLLTAARLLKTIDECASACGTSVDDATEKTIEKIARRDTKRFLRVIKPGETPDDNP
ncbi:MAG: hypothetical protein COV10_02460 [Candidatus Vogelbacteria bacterium CG10_big_fil_rev_8_21_14_0_10_51_16]|uniref:NTP pyrophosphohydrolase MazG-like domain-containing protein n=1 Tax=Candidatus Vogelbacteria bacterium CG10_big_fil_rev_8_21_14_0_10_51_16 TaxID=1975045 RepID=A0A2H0RE83_9BACT|nr:MAG: hypothetical protein COV10_02460 [Candidatus Vogelbacteria bacterium CG10_big_fil_rev_8_21_14_0_10_51_16]